MKILCILIIVLFNSLASACPNISGKYQGICEETFYGQPELNKNPELIFEIDQLACEQVTVKMIVKNSGIYMVDSFNLTVDKTEMFDGEKAKIFSSGKFDKESFTGVIDYVSKHSGNTVFKFTTTYTKTEKSGASRLEVLQTSKGGMLKCDIPAVN